MRTICMILAVATIVGCGGSDEAPVGYEMQGEGPIALVFVHETACEPGDWSDPIAHFSRDHTVVNLDRTVDRPEEIKRLIEDLELERLVLVGHSRGGTLALATAKLLPQRVLGVVGVETEQEPGYHALILDGTQPGEFNRLLAEAVEELTGA